MVIKLNFCSDFGQDFEVDSSRLVNLIDVALACEDANSKLVDVDTVAYVDDYKRVGNSLLQVSS